MALFDNRYELLELIGRGAFSEVWKARDTLTNVVQALKIYSPSTGMDTDGIQMLTHEFSLVCSLNHSNLLRPNSFAICNGNTPYLTFPYCQRGNTYGMMGHFLEKDIWRLLRDIASALKYLHAKNPPIIHQDIKPANIMMGDEGEFLLSDFGVSIKAILSRSKQDNAEKDFISSGTLPYMAPERFSRNNRPILANDIYSLGATVFELATGYLPFGNEGGVMLKNGADVPEVTGDYSPQLKETIESCLAKDPWKRPKASELEVIAEREFHKRQGTVIETSSPVLNTHMDSHAQAADDGISKPTDQSKRKRMLWFILSSILLLIGISFAIYFFFPFKDSKPVSPNQTIIENEPTIIKEPVILEPEGDSTATIAIEEVKAAVSEANETSRIKEEIPAAEEKQTVREERKSQPSSIDLGYAIWNGPSQNGQPHGYGKMIFKKDHRIDSRDPQNYIAKTGDIVEGTYYNGHLEDGAWTKNNDDWKKENGEKILILIGKVK